MLPGLNVITNVFALKFFRKAFKLQTTNKGIILSLVAFALTPAFAGSALLNIYFKDNLLKLSSYNLNECLLCREVKATGIYYGIGSLASFFGLYGSSLLYANMLATYPIPKLSVKLIKDKAERAYFLKNYKTILKKTTKNFSPLFLKTSLTTIILTNIVLYLQQREFFSLESELSNFDINDIESLQVGQENLFNKSVASKLNPFKKNDVKKSIF